MIPEERREKIIDFLKIRKTASISEVSNEFEISDITVRRDLDILSKRGVIKKVYGGAATLSHSIHNEPELLKRIQEYSEEKKRIAAEAIKRISNNDIIIIESGSTCIELTNNLYLKNNIKVITIAPHIVINLSNLKRNGKFNGEIICTGGILRGDPDDIFVGPQGIKFFENIKVKTAFFGIFAININDGWMVPSDFEAELTKKIVSSSKKIIGITHHSKFNNTSFSKVGPLNLFDEIITDSGLDNETYKKYKKFMDITLC